MSTLSLCTLADISTYVIWLLPGPRWYRKGSRTKLLLASRRSDESRRRKTAGNIADGLRCCIWRRAEKPEKMTHHLTWGGKNNGGYIALLHPSELASRQPQYVQEALDCTRDQTQGDQAEGAQDQQSIFSWHVHPAEQHGHGGRRHLSFLQDKRGQSNVLTEVSKECSHICKVCTFVSFFAQKECSWNICAL